MPETTEAAPPADESQAVAETPAVPADFDPGAEADEAIARAERPAPTRRKKTRTGRRESAEMTARRRAAYEAGERSKDKEYDEWIEDWDWNQPRMYCTLKRTSPQLHLGRQVGGRLDGKPNGYFTEEEIQQRFGGGTFVVFVSGIDQRTGKFRALGSRQVVIGAEPRIEAAPQQVVDAGTGAPVRQGGTGVEDLAPQAQAGLVGLLGEQMKHNREAGPASTADPEVLAQMQRAYEQQAQAVAAAADARVSDFRQQLDSLRVENEKLRAENTSYQQKIETEISAVRSEGDRFVGQMLPTFASQADQRVQQILHDTGEKVRTIQEQYARDQQIQQAHYQQALQNQQTLFQAAESNAQTLFQGQIQNLQNINAALQLKIDSLEGEARALRDQVMNMHQEAARKQDPMQRLQEMQTLQEVIQGMAGGGGGDDLGEDASPALKLAARFAPAIAGAIDVAKAKMGIMDAPQPMPQPMPPQQMPPRMVPPGAVPRVAVPQPPPGAMVKAPAQPQQAKPQAQRRARIPRQDAKVRKQDLVAGITLLNAAIATGTTPQLAADTASNQIDRSTLNALCSRRPEVVIQSLQAAGILQGAVASIEGQQYLTEFLHALQARLNPAPSTPPPAPAQQQRQPQPQPAKTPPAAEPPEGVAEEPADEKP